MRNTLSQSVQFVTRYLSARLYSGRVAYPKAVHLSYAVHDLEQTGSWELGSLGNRDCPLLLLHGLFGAKSNWHSIAKRLATEGRRVITVDVRNHGDSEHNPYMDYFVMRDDILQLMDELHIDESVLLGHSMGGKIAMTLALTHPERLKALVVADVAPVASPGGTQLLSYAERMKQFKPHYDIAVSAARKEADLMLRPVVESPVVRQFLLTNLVDRNGRVQWRHNVESIISNYLNIMDFPEMMNTFTKPTKFIGGSLSHHISEDTVPEIRRLFPTADISHIPGVGHWVHSENTAEFLTLLNEFLDKIS